MNNRYYTIDSKSEEEYLHDMTVKKLKGTPWTIEVVGYNGETTVRELTEHEYRYYIYLQKKKELVQ